jgi:3'(2'), 5'-bisphosphate nucleotidase
MLKLLEGAVNAAVKAGVEILQIYNRDFEVTYKADESPLSEADTASNTIICNLLRDLNNLPILSEENKEIAYSDRKNWNSFWLVDPLDGTKEFIKKNGEFTVNIALIENGIPVLGVVYAPVLNTLYYGFSGRGSFKCENIKEDMPFESIVTSSKKLPIQKTDSVYKVVASRSHKNEETIAFVDNLKSKYASIEEVSIGSSLKLCLVAEGNADIYPRLGPTMEWDTAAAHAVVKHAGKSVKIHNEDKELCYNKPNLLNPWFVVS